MARQPHSSKAAFTEIAERTRLGVQKLIAETASGAGPLSEGEISALVWAQLSGTITAVANGFAGLVQRGAPGIATVEQMRKALLDQFDSAFQQAMLQRRVAND